MRRTYSLVLAVPFVLLTLVAPRPGPPAAALEQEAHAPIAPVAAHAPAGTTAREREPRGIVAGQKAELVKYLKSL